MEERTLRTWHRRVGAGLAALLALQAFSGLWLSLEAAWGWLEGYGAVSTARLVAHQWARDLHHGGGPWGSVYRTALACATLWMAGSGGWILRKIRARRRR
ncbi:MAG: hypothetical protein Kow0092_03990 [Deferrisomatales bacterium]